MNTTDLSPQKILQALPKSRERSISLNEMAEVLNLSDAQKIALHKTLEKFVRLKLAAAEKGRYFRKPNSAVLIGTLRCTRTGYAFVTPDDERERERGDLFISEKGIGSAMHGDKVIVRVIGQSARGRDGWIETVLQRANKTVVGKFSKSGNGGYVTPIETRLLYDIEIAPADTHKARHGEFVHVEITRVPSSHKLPAGRIIEVLGDETTKGIDIEIIIRKHNLPFVFPQPALSEAENIDDAINETTLSGREDLRHWLTITIDGETARDFDDAVSLDVLANGRMRLGVHIADVSYFVRDGSPLDEEAFRRGTSVYFPERAIPMLPERLSNDVCSLRPRVDRLTMSAIMEVDGKGRVVDYRLTPSIIHSRERMTYTAVNEILTNPEGETANRYAHIKEMLLAMRDLALVLIKRREAQGAIDFDLPEAELFFNDEGQIGGIVRAERNLAHRLIEEFMLMANETVATHFEKLPVPCVYRIHDEPNPPKVKEFSEIAASFGHNFSMHGDTPQRGFQHLAREIEGKPEERMLSYLMLRSMQRAKYSAKNTGHFGLAMKTYTHFTSPIRRYPDLIVHRLLREIIEKGNADEADWQVLDLGQKRALKQMDREVFEEAREIEIRRMLESIAEQSSLRERAADDAERELMDWRKADFMAEHVGSQFNGVITSIKDFGFYVELEDYFVEGLVHITTLADDTYIYNERRHRLTAKRSGLQLQLGDLVRVSVDKVDRDRHLIDFSLVKKR
ncbi:MAG: ribonuclease R [Acidobacteriota bacterium]